jgi:hypothetical protein
MKDRFGRELNTGDICFRYKTGSVYTRSYIIPVKILHFSKERVYTSQNTYVESKSLIKASAEGMLFESDKRTEDNIG